MPGSAVLAVSCDPHPVRRPGAARHRHDQEAHDRCCDPHPVRRPGAARASSTPRRRRLSLRSSPGPKTGCSRSTAAPREPGTGCDPHPVRRPGAGLQVLALTSAVMPLRSSPGPKTGCRPGASALDGVGGQVAILTRSEDRVQQAAIGRAREGNQVAILTRSEDRVQIDMTKTKRPTTDVAILTRSEDRVQLGNRGRAKLGDRVAILTRSEDRVQRAARPGRRHAAGRCDPHPVRRPGAVHLTGLDRARRARCDPHPVRRPGAATRGGPGLATERRRCDPHPVRRPGAAPFVPVDPQHGPPVAILTRSEDRVQRRAPQTEKAPVSPLRSSPGPKTGCSAGRTEPGPAMWALRSSPGPKTGCSLDGLAVAGKVAPVAILTRSEDRVQQPVGCPIRHRHGCCDPHPVRRPGAARNPDAIGDVALQLRSSPGPKTGCSLPPGGLGVGDTGLRSSPGPKTGCSSSRACGTALSIPSCDPHPVRRPGAARGGSRHVVSSECVAILTRSEDRVQPPRGRRACRSAGRCDPHPVRRPGAATSRAPCLSISRTLRSSPGPKTGCSLRVHIRRQHHVRVAILTRSEDRVQRPSPIVGGWT